jgi:hypothetical protein
MIDKIRILIIEIQLLAYLWMELIKIIVYFKNRSLIKLLLDTISWESFHKEKFNFSNLRIIGLFVYYYNIETEIDPNRRIKSDPRNRQTNIIEYDKGFS